MNYLEYKKYFNSDAHVRVFKVAIKANDEMINEEIANLFNFILKNNPCDLCNNYVQDNPNYKFANLEQAFCRHYCTMQNDERVYLQLKNLKQESIEKSKCVL